MSWNGNSASDALHFVTTDTLPLQMQAGPGTWKASPSVQ